ncbi:MAG: PAS domain S-box protein [Prosthecochloris sp.]|nr:PAS domain S-box protein [Prosthecochloris sp.]
MEPDTSSLPPEKYEHMKSSGEEKCITPDDNQLLQSFQRLSMVVEGTAAGSWDWNIRSGELVINERWAEITGYRLDELAPVSIELWKRLCHPDDLERSNTLLQEHFQGKTALYEMELRMRHKDGSWVWVLDRGKVFERDSQGNPLRMVGSHQDISARKKAEEELENERKLFTSGPVCMFRWASTPGWPVEYVSSNIEDLLGYRAEDLMHGNLTYEQIIHPEDREFIVDEVGYYTRQQVPFFEQEYRLVKADGSAIWIYDHTVVHRDPDGRIVHLQGYILDYTSKKESETYLRQRLEFEHLIATISNRFINLALDEIDPVIDDLLRLIGKHVEADRSYIFQFYDNDTLMDNTHEWCADGIEPQIEILKGIPADISEWWMERVRSNEIIHIPDVADIPDEEAALRDILQQQDIKSLMVIPLVSNNRSFGYIGFDAVQKHRSWHPETISVLQLAGGMIASALKRKETETALEAELDLALRLSASDSLQQTLQLCLDTAISISRMDCGGIYLIDPADNCLKLEVHSGLPESFIQHTAYFPPDHHHMQTVLTGRPLYRSLLHEPESPDDTLMRDEGLKAVAILPVTYKGSVIACMNIASHTLNHVPESSRKGVESVISHIGAAFMQARHEEQVNETRLNFETLFNSLDDYLFIVDRQGRVVGTNEAVRNALDYTPEEVAGKPVLEFHPADQHEKARKNIESMLQGSSDVCMVPLVTRKGEQIPVETKVSPGIWNHQPVLFGISRNITELRKAEKALRENEQRFRELTEMLPQPVFESDTGTTITYANRTALELFGYTSGELTGSFSLCNLTESASHHLIRKSLGNLLKGTKRESTEVHALKKSGDKFPAILYSTPIIHDGRVTGFRATFFDMTRHREIEEARREAELKKRVIEKYRNMLHNIPGIVYTTSRSGHMDFLLSPKVVDITGYKASEIMDMEHGWASIVHPEDLGRYRTTRLQRSSRPRQLTISYRITAKNGQVKWLEDHSSLLEKSTESHLAADGIILDITDRITAETEKNELEGQLRQAQRLETIGTLAGGIAHDFNNILTPIMGYAEMLEMMIGNQDQGTEYVKEIRKASERAKHLVEQILTFSRMDESRQGTMNLATVIDEALKLLRPSIPVTIDIIADIDTHAGFITGDASQMHQVIVNLCTNAYQAMEASGGQLTISLKETIPSAEFVRIHPSLAEQPYAVLKISDTGKGMDKKTIQHIFEPFFTTKPVNKGTGLGLSVVHGIITQHGGTIVVDSVLSKGSTFSIYLPKAEELHEPEENPDKSEKTGSKREASVLLVDDEEANAMMLGRMLTLSGYHVTPETSALAALRKIQGNPGGFDLLITDLTMPEMTGITLAAGARLARPDLPVLMITGHGNDQALMQAVNLDDIQYVLRKPVQLETLQNTIEKILSMHK